MVAMPSTTTKRGYTGLADYAEQHNGTEEMFLAAGWQKAIVSRIDRQTKKPRPALAFKTSTGMRYRFIDGDRPTYDQNPGYEMCWYGLARAVKMGKPYIVDCNGAASTVPAQHKGLPAFSLQSGEGTHPKPHLLDELKKLWRGSIIVAMDCDEAGRKGAVTRVQDYLKAGLNAVAVDLALPNDGGDLADFVALHDNPVEAILKLNHIFVPAIVQSQPKPKQQQEKELTFSEEMEKAQRAVNALSTTRRDERDSWYQVGAALYTTFGDNPAAFSIWDNWSRGSAKYKENDAKAVWKSFGGEYSGSRLHVDSIYKWANQDYGTSWSNTPKPYKVSSKLDVEVTEPISDSWQWTQGLPFGVRAALNLYAYPAIAPLLELWVEAINAGMCKPDDLVDVVFLRCVSETLNRGVTISTLRNGLKQGAGQFLLNMSQYIYINNTSIESLDSIESTSDSNIQSDIITRNTTPCELPGKAGRPGEHYQLLPCRDIISALAKLAIAPILEKAFPIENGIVAPIRTEFLAELGCEPEHAKQLRAELESKYQAVIEKQPNYQTALRQARTDYQKYFDNLTNPTSYPIAKDRTYKNTTDYTAACARAFIDYHGGDTQFSRQTLCDRIGCQDRNLATILTRAGVQVVKHQYVDKPIKSVAQLGAIKQKWDWDLPGFPKKLISSGKKDGYTFIARNPKMMAWAESELKRGSTLSLRYSQANKQTTKMPDKVPAPEPDDEPQDYKQAELPKPLSTLTRFFVARAIQQLVDWLNQFVGWLNWIKHFLTELCEQHRIIKPPAPKYAEQWIEKVTSLIPTGEVESFDPETGEIKYTEPTARGDPLLDALAGMGCKIVETNEDKHGT